ncbi:mechanosensitive ion channel family protein [Janthinobacterium fluminis]|uniref:Mechanosensitive ion channel n=1 Tax=Janthinobacterium fluminis TaxID=2987524 RepID=A0ABT5K219_9BURK|nr:mechanosensitive ion channel domain-containing protein [Janthinobacterium fluminis]MDC8759032.1 mechanosensitive ion channel [Janthinobacterium fluminis]
MTQIPLLNLIADFADDVRNPAMMWQIGAIIVSITLGWGLARGLRAAFVRHGLAPAAARFGMESFMRVLTPLSIAALLAGAKFWLGKSQHVHLLSVALPLCSSLALIRCGFYLLRKVFARHGQVGAAIITFEKIFALLVWLAVALYITGLWPDLFEYLEDTTLPLGKNKVAIATILQAIVSVAVLLMLALWAGAALEERLMKVQGLHSSLRVVIARMGRAVLILVSVLLSLSLVGIDLTVLSVFGGALGVGLGLGLQKIASNYVSGFIILLDRSLSIGDMITVDKYSGRVTHINTRYTVLQGLDGVESIVPNEMFVSGAVQNSSLSNRNLWLATQVSVAYDSDLDQVLELLVAAASSIERVAAEPAPSATLQRFGADGLDLQVGFWINDPENGRGGVTSDVNRAIWRALKANNISLPYPQREVRIIGTPRAGAGPLGGEAGS